MTTDDMAVLYAIGRDPGTAWMEQALCPEVDPDLFFVEYGPIPDAARKVCAACPVRAQCLEYGLSRELLGVWGGTSDSEREQIRLNRSLRLAA